MGDAGKEACMRISMPAVVVAGILLIGLSGNAMAQGQVVLKRKGKEAELVDSATYVRSKKEYRILKRPGTFVLPEAEIEYVKPPKPAGLDRLKDVAVLQQIVQKYRGLWWDVAAFQRLMPLHIQNREYKKAISLYEDVRPAMDMGLPVVVHHHYWVALLMTDQKSTLRRELERWVTSGQPEGAAWAYVMRGDLLMREGQEEQALVDGYLRTVLMFEDVRSCRREALEKTIRAMERVGDHRAETYRKALREEFPEPEPAAKPTAGSGKSDK